MQKLKIEIRKLISLLAKFNYNKAKRFLLPIGLVFGIYILYQILGWFSHHNEVKNTNALPTVDQIAAIPESRVNVGTITPVSNTPVVDDIIAPQVNTLLQQARQERDEFAKINNTLNNQQTVLNNLNTSVTNLSASIEMLTKNGDL